MVIGRCSWPAGEKTADLGTRPTDCAYPTNYIDPDQTDLRRPLKGGFFVRKFCSWALSAFEAVFSLQNGLRLEKSQIMCDIFLSIGVH